MMRDDCNVWEGPKDKDGYGLVFSRAIRNKYKTNIAHRVLYMQAFGPIPKGLVIDHICGNKSCVNVCHLRVVDRATNTTENSRSVSAVNKAKTHCINGHFFNEENTYYRKGGGRMCRACHRQANYRARGTVEKHATR
jgi:hypothetical protein